MLIFLFLPFVGVAEGVDFSECIPGAMELGPITLRNTPYFSNNLFTPLQMTILSNDTNTAYGLLWEMASSYDVTGRINGTDHQGMTLLHWAAFFGNNDIVKSLLCFGSDVNALDKEGNTPLHLAAQSLSSDTIKQLITSGSDINAKNSYGSTPLHLAIKNGAFPVVLTLLAHKGRTDIEDNRGRVALDAAVASGNVAIINLLTAIGAKVKAELKPTLFQWTDKGGGKNPVAGGHGGFCSEVEYVGRVHYEGNIIPAKVCPKNSKAYAAYNGKELALDEYEILDSEHIAWEPMNENKKIPHDALVGGRTKDGENLYIGRAKLIHGGMPNLASGKVSPADKLLRTTFNDKEYTFNKYEILILH